VKRILFIIGLLTAFILLLTAGLSCSPSQKTVSLGKEFTIRAGKTAVIKGENLTVKFVEVTGDSRCAKGVQCVWAGEAKCQMYLTYNGATSDVVFTQQGGSVTEQDFLTRYKASFILEPYPEYGKKIDASDYQLVMTITK
jgi:hypothetical protein